MPTLQPFPAGGYRFISHQFQYSGGVAAEPGFRIERARFPTPVPLAEGFDAIEAYLAGIGRLPTAFCACELRSPAQFTDAGFVAFNRHYVERLAAWGIFRDEVNPVARSNVCSEIDPPATSSFYAFSYTVPNDDGSLALSLNRQSIADFEADLSNNLYKLWNRLSSGSYFSLLTAAADANLQLIKIITSKLPFDWGSKVESALRIFGADRALLLIEGVAIAKGVMLGFAYPFRRRR